MHHNDHVNLAISLRSFLLTFKREITNKAVSSSMLSSGDLTFAFVGNKDQAVVTILLPKGTEITHGDALRISDLVISDERYAPIYDWLYRLEWEVHVMNGTCAVMQLHITYP